MITHIFYFWQLANVATFLLVNELTIEFLNYPKILILMWWSILQQLTPKGCYKENFSQAKLEILLLLKSNLGPFLKKCSSVKSQPLVTTAYRTPLPVLVLSCLVLFLSCSFPVPVLFLYCSCPVHVHVLFLLKIFLFLWLSVIVHRYVIQGILWKYFKLK